MDKMSKRILVTGAAGLIGSHLCRALLQQKHHVIGMDNFYSSDGSNLRELAHWDTFRFIEHDVTQCFFEEVDEIYHLACPASPYFYQRSPVATMKTSFLGTLHALENAERAGARILLASTSEVYGDPLEHPQKESYWGHVNPNGVRSCYDEGKRAAETLMCDYRRAQGTETRIARIFNTYGPGMLAHDGRVISNFIMQSLRGEPMTLFGNGEQTRSFCYVSDTVRGLIALMQAKDHSEPVNIGNPEEITIAELAKVIGSELDGVSIVYKPLPKDDPVRRCPDITRAQSLLGWSPEIPLAEGIGRVITDFRKRYNQHENILSD